MLVTLGLQTGLIDNRKEKCVNYASWFMVEKHSHGGKRMQSLHAQISCLSKLV